MSLSQGISHNDIIKTVNINVFLSLQLYMIILDIIYFHNTNSKYKTLIVCNSSLTYKYMIPYMQLSSACKSMLKRVSTKLDKNIIDLCYVEDELDISEFSNFGKNSEFYCNRINYFRDYLMRHSNYLRKYYRYKLKSTK